MANTQGTRSPRHPSTPYARPSTGENASDRVGQILTEEDNSTSGMPTYASQLTDTQNYESLGRLMTRKSSITGAASTVPVLSSGYEYDSNNRRRALALSDGSSWAYDYDAKGEVISGKRAGSAGTPAIGAIYTSPTSPTIQHDFDGNLTSDGEVCSDDCGAASAH